MLAIISSAVLLAGWATSLSLPPASAITDPIPPIRDAGTRAAQDLINRLVPDHADRFVLSRADKGSTGHAACFSIDAVGDKVHIFGTTGVEIATGFHHFLKEICGSSISWALTGGNRIDTTCLENGSAVTLLQENGPVRRSRSAPWHYYQNVVTVSYSSTWWDWERWQQEIDWMAMNGVNLPLAFTGQEYVWQKVFARFNVTPADLTGFFTGPAFLAWGRMGNVQGHGGPLPQAWIGRQADLQHKILGRMRAFGMTPVLPAFAGFVPRSLVTQHPGSTFLRLPNWGGFPEENCCVHLLDPLDPLFHKIGKTAIEEFRREFGRDSVSFYSADTFNEMLPPKSEPAFLSSVSSAVYSAMVASDANATWLMQAWTFFNDPGFWQNAQIKAYVDGVPKGRLVLLDLYAEVGPLWERTAAFSGAPFIWCMLHNFGGNSEMYGNLEAVAREPARALAAAPSLIGWGLCMEAIEQNPVVYSLMNEIPFRKNAIEVRGWLEGYVTRRYGLQPPSRAHTAWQLLWQSVYNATDGHLDHAKDIPTSRPGLSSDEIGQWGLRPELWYNPQMVLSAWRLLTMEAGTLDSPPSTLVFDLVDVGRQVLSKHSTAFWMSVVAAYITNNATALAAASDDFLGILQDLDSLLATHEGFLLGPRLEAAKQQAVSDAEAALFELNERTQLTVWGVHPGGHSEVEDYANREWAGLLGAYYNQRWRLWLQRLASDLERQQPYNATEWQQECLKFSHSWIKQRTSFPTKASGNAVAVSEQLLNKYFPSLPAVLLPVA